MPTMEALRYHTYNGVAHDAGDRYEADPAYVETLEAIGFAKVAAGEAHTTPPEAPEAAHDAHAAKHSAHATPRKR